MKKEERKLCLTGVLGIVLIVALVTIVNQQPLKRSVVIQEDLSPPIARGEDLPVSGAQCASLPKPGYCYDEISEEFCNYNDDGSCPGECVCRIE